MGIDPTDIRILNLLSSNPDICQQEIADALGMTQPAVCFRIKKLKQEGILREGCGIDLKKLGLSIFIAFGEGSPEFLKRNPYIIEAFRAGEKTMAILATENRDTARAVAKKMLRAEQVREIKDYFGPLALNPTETPRCTTACNRCELYGKCLGLPGTEWYRGSIF